MELAKLRVNEKRLPSETRGKTQSRGTKQSDHVTEVGLSWLGCKDVAERGKYQA